MKLPLPLIRAHAAGILIIVFSMIMPTCSGSGTGIIYSLEDVTHGSDVIVIVQTEGAFVDYLQSTKVTYFRVYGYLKNPKPMSEFSLSYFTPLSIGPITTGSTVPSPTFIIGQTYILFLSENSRSLKLYKGLYGKYPISEFDDPLISKVQEILGSRTVESPKLGFLSSKNNLPAFVTAMLLTCIFKRFVLDS